MRQANVLLLSAVFLALCGIAYELHTLNRALGPLNRIPVSNAVDYGRSDETREQRIERIARTRLRGREDERAISAREHELELEHAPKPIASPSQSQPPAHR
jgi:hypothetical protein